MIPRSTDRDAFKNRIRWCVVQTGSIYALAKSIGVAPNTIRGYLNKSEPTRPHLVAIAEECRVSIEWLATGSHDKAPDKFQNAPISNS